MDKREEIKQQIGKYINDGYKQNKNIEYLNHAWKFQCLFMGIMIQRLLKIKCN